MYTKYLSVFIKVECVPLSVRICSLDHGQQGAWLSSFFLSLGGGFKEVDSVDIFLVVAFEHVDPRNVLPLVEEHRLIETILRAEDWRLAAIRHGQSQGPDRTAYVVLDFLDSGLDQVAQGDKSKITLIRPFKLV